MISLYTLLYEKKQKKLIKNRKNKQKIKKQEKIYI